MSQTKSPEEVARDMWGRFDAGNVAEESRRHARHDARAKEVREENERWLRRDTDIDITGIATDLAKTGDMGANDSTGGSMPGCSS